MPLIDSLIGQENSLGDIEELYKLKGVAFDNLFDVEIIPPTEVKNKFTSVGWSQMKFRIKSFTIPEDATQSDDITIRGITVSKPLGNYNTNNDLSFDMVVENDFANYKALQYWKSLYGNASTGTRSLSNSILKGTVIINSSIKQQDGLSIIGWKFQGVQLFSIGEIAYDHSSGEPITISLQFKFAGYEVL